MGSIKAFAVMNGSVHFHVSEDDVRAPHPIPPSPPQNRQCHGYRVCINYETKKALSGLRLC